MHVVCKAPLGRPNTSPCMMTQASIVNSGQCVLLVVCCDGGKAQLLHTVAMADTAEVRAAADRALATRMCVARYSTGSA